MGLQPQSAAPRYSAATAALLSFLFPGLGQGFVRQWRAALIFAAPVLALLAVIATYLAEGLTHAALRLLDPMVALLATVIVVQLGLWRALSVLHAWRAGVRGAAGIAMLPVLVLAIALTHGLGAWYTLSFMQAGERMFIEDVALDTDLWPVNDDPLFDEPQPADQTPAPGETANPTNPVDTDEPPERQVPDEEEPYIEPGPAPEIDTRRLDGANDDWTNVLIVGVDWAEGRTHALTDTMIVVATNTARNDVYMFSFPRDIAEFPLYDGGRYMGRLNSFANFARRNPDRYPGGGMKALSRQIGFLLGVPIDHYAAVTIPGFKSVMDTVGEITVYNAREIRDHRRNFHLPVGNHRLDTDTTMHFVRSRYGPGNNDFVRAARQQEVLAALRHEILRADRVGELPRIIDGVSRVLSTNYPPGRINEAVRLAEVVGRRPTDSWVFSSPTWAVHPPMSETGGRWIIRLRMDRIANLSREVFGRDSLYSR